MFKTTGTAQQATVETFAEEFKDRVRWIDDLVSPFAVCIEPVVSRTLTDSKFVIPPKVLKLCEQLVQLGDAIDLVQGELHRLDWQCAAPDDLVKAGQAVRVAAGRLCAAIPKAVCSPGGLGIQYWGSHGGLGLHRAVSYAKIILDCRDRNMRGEPTYTECKP